VGSVWRIRPSPKTRHGRRLVSIGEQTLALLQQQRARVAEMALQLGRDYDRKLDLIFPGPGGAPLRPSYLSGRLAAVRDRLGLPKDIQPCHGWRHSHATELVGGGLDPAAVSKRLGHSTVAFTLDRYVHPNREKDRQAAEIGEAKLKL
jgi:integrase